MSSPQNGLNGQQIASQSDSRPSSHGSSRAYRQDRNYGDSELREDMQMDEGRMSGELEGSTLGSSSRDGERGSQRHRRGQTSGGFLLDTPFLSSSKLLRTDHHHQHQSEPTAAVKREAPEPEIVVPKRKSRRPWHRHKQSVGSSPLATAVTNASNAEEIPQHTLEASGFGVATQTPHRHTSAATTSPLVGLGTDPAQIVNLALNLSESRRRNYAGRFPSTPLPASRRISAIGPPSFPLTESNTQRLNGGYWQHQSHGSRGPGYMQPVNTYRSDPCHAYTSPTEFSDTSSLAPIAIDNDSQIDYDFSDATLARAERARNHFELFFEYLRLLPHLPPLRPYTRPSSASSASSARDEALTGRVYNPLQCIRNRKIRYREKSSIDTEGEGWQDVARVHEWVSAVEAADSQGHDDPDLCVRLPPFQYGHMEKPAVDEKDADRSTTSPSSSTRRPFGTSSVKARRPRLDWIIMPAELLADAAWLEDPVNKVKILDKDSNRLYPDPAMLKRSEWKQPDSVVDEEPIKEKRQGPKTDKYDLSDSLPTFERSSHKGRHFGRGRHRHRLHESLHLATSPSGSDREGKPSWRKSFIGSDSSSSDTSDNESLRGRARHSHWRKRLHGSYEDNDRPRKSNSLVRQSEQPFSKHDIVDETANKDASGATYAASASPPEVRINNGKLPAVQGARNSVSSAGTAGERDDIRLSLEDQDSTAPNSPLYRNHFPSIAVNLSPPSSRSPSPSKKALPKIIGSLHEKSWSKQRNKLEFEEPIYVTSPESPLLEKCKTVEIDPLERIQPLESIPTTNLLSPSSPDVRGGSKRNKLSQESKLRGIFKGGRIAEIVGNEVSKVGDFIRKKDAHSHSRKSSSASSLISDHNNDSEDEKVNGGSKTGAENLIKRLPTLADENSGLSRKETEKDVPKTFNPNLPIFISPFKQDGDNDKRKTSELDSSPSFQGVSVAKIDNTVHREISEAPSRLSPILQKSKLSVSDRRSSYGFPPSLNVWNDQITSRRRQVKDVCEPYIYSRPPITGLANAEVSTTSPRKRRPTISTRAWSISERSVTTIGESELTDKKEIERVKALLLSSGIKAREICRRAESVRSPPSDFLVKSLLDPKDPIPCVPYFEEFDCVARNFVRRFEDRRSSLRQSMDKFSGATSPTLKFELEKLEMLLSQSLTPRVRAAAIEAETLTTQLNTTSTLAVKELNDALERGVRKRNRRFRWVRRTGFVLLEWLLVGVMWWVWLIVMIFKVARGVWRASISGIRWVFWL